MLSLLVLSAGAVALAGCGGGDETSFSDNKIVEELKLEKAEDAGGYTIKDDPFCEIGSNLLNDSGEVDSALDDKRPVLASREGNVGVESKLLAPDCKDRVQRKLNKLDPVPKDEEK